MKCNQSDWVFMDLWFTCLEVVMEKHLCQWYKVFFREEQQNWRKELCAFPWTVFQLFLWWSWHCIFFYYSMFLVFFLKRHIFIVQSASSPSLKWNTTHHVKSFWQLCSLENIVWGPREMQGMVEYNMNSHLRQEKSCRTDQWKIWLSDGKYI